MFSECEKPDYNVLSVTKQLITKAFSRPDADMSMPYLVLYLNRRHCFWDLTACMLSSCCQKYWSAIKNEMIPFHMWPMHESMWQTHVNWNGAPSSHRLMQKIGNSNSRNISSHSNRDGNGNFTLLIDSVTKNVLNFDDVSKHYHELNEYISNRIMPLESRLTLCLHHCLNYLQLLTRKGSLTLHLWLHPL